MTTQPTARPLVAVDDSYDRDYASDGNSRYGAYLRSRAYLLHDDGEALHSTHFAVVCWRIATSPVMAPPYADTRADVEDVTVGHTGNGGITATVTVRLPWPASLHHAEQLRGWQSWHQRTSYATGDPRFHEPDVDNRPALLHTAALTVPIRTDAIPARTNLTPWRNTRRTLDPGHVEVTDAKTVVRAICDAVNTTAGPVVDLLRTATQ